MEEKKHCKWYNDEFCTNDKSPCVADYCPVVGYPELCKFREENLVKEKSKEVNDLVKEKKLTDENTLEFADDVVDLLVEFDEMGFAPTTTCPDPDEYTRDFRERLFCAIKRVQEELECEKHNHGVTKEFYDNSVKNSEKIFAEQKAEIKTLKAELRKECEEHEEFTKKAKEEIEFATKVISMSKRKTKIADLLKEIDYLKNCADNFLADYQKAQKQVDELEEERENMQAVIFGLEEDKRQLLKRLDEEFVSLKAVKAAEISPKAMKMLVESVGCVQKDTAKEIFTGIKESFVFAFIGASEDYEKGYCDALKDCDKQLCDFAKEEYGVEIDE